MAGGLHKKSFAQALHWNCDWVNHLLEDKARPHRGENLKCYMTVACFPPLAPFYPKRKQTKKITIKRKYRVIEVSRPNPSRTFVCNYWTNRYDIWISVKSLVPYLKTDDMSQMHVQLPTGRQVNDIGKPAAGIWPCILMYLLIILKKHRQY